MPSLAVRRTLCQVQPVQPIRSTVATLSAIRKIRSFAKTKVLEPGEEAEVTMTFKASDLASYDTDGAQWKVDAGTYEVLIAASATDIRQKATINVKAATQKLHDVMKPSVELNLLKR